MTNLNFQAITYPNGKFESQAMCNEDKTDGFRVRWHESSKIKSATAYKHGKPDGLLTAWHENGNKSAEINYQDGHRHGVCTLWHKDGLKRSEVVYSNGKMNGLWVSWCKTGQIRHAIFFKNCRKKSETTWYSNGNIKSNTELGMEYCSSRLNKFSDVSYDDWVDYYLPHTFGSNLLSGGIRYPTLMTYWYESGQKSKETIQYYYDYSDICWHENGQKSFEMGKGKDDPCMHWSDNGVKEYEYVLTHKEYEEYEYLPTHKEYEEYEYLPTHDISKFDMRIAYKFFDSKEQYIMTVIETEHYDKFTEWKFLNNNDNKVYEYKHNYLKNTLLASDELWDIWLNSGPKEFVTMLKSSKSHQSVFCRLNS